MVLKKSWVLFFLFSFLWEVSSASPLDRVDPFEGVSPSDGEFMLEGGSVTSLDGVSPSDGEFMLEGGNLPGPKPAIVVAHRNAILLIEALKNEDMESISYFSEKELTQVFLYARGLRGGNLLHYMARDKNLNSEFLEKVFRGKYREKSEYACPPNEEYTVCEEIFEGLVKILPQKTIRKALKLRNNEGFTPIEYARQNQNQPFLKILQEIKGNYNDSIVATQGVLTKLAVVGMPVGLGVLTLGGVGHDGGLALLTASGLALCRANFLESKKLP